MNALLLHPRMAGTAAVVHEFGAIPLDHDLIDHGADKTVVRTNGRLCCNLAGDMEDAVMRLFSRRQVEQIPHFERLIIEPSGLSDPAPIAQAILRNPVMSRSMRLGAIVTAADSLFAEAQLDRHPETRKQVALADCLVLAKTDLVPAHAAGRLRSTLRDHNPAAPVLSAVLGAVDAGSLFPPALFNQTDTMPAPYRPRLFAESVDPDHTGRHASISLTADHPLHWPAFDAWLRRIRIGHADQLFRVKGLLNIAGAQGRSWCRASTTC